MCLRTKRRCEHRSSEAETDMDRGLRLENKVIDLEVAHQTPSPTVDPSIHVMLIGHSMGGIVAAETYLLLAKEQPVPAASSRQNPERPNYPSNTTLNSSTSTSHPNPPVHEDASHAENFMFPHIQGILAFDTPFLGLAPGMVAHGLESSHKTMANAYNTYNEVTSMFGWGAKSEAAVGSAASSSRAVGALPAPTSAAADAAAAPKWQSWGKYAMFAGAAGAVVAGGAAALYSQKEKLSTGWQWAGDHLLFVSELFKPERLQKRVKDVEQACKERGSGCGNLFTNLGKGAREGYGITSSLAGKERTFCNLPVNVMKDGREVQASQAALGAGSGFKWTPSVNEKAQDETTAHMAMFYPRDNPGYFSLGERAKEFLAAWVDQGWYQASDGPTHMGKDHGVALGELGDGWEKPDYDAEEVKAKENERDRYRGHHYPDPDVEGNLARDWEGVDVHKGRDGLDGDDDDDDHDGGFRMRDGGEDLHDSIIVERAALNGEVPLPRSRADTGT